MKKFYWIAVLTVSLSAQAQNAQEEINLQVWKPFISSFNSHDAAGFLAVHSKDVVRSPRDGKTISGWDEYLKSTQTGNQRALSEGRKHTLELHFTERIANADKAIEVGIYKTTSTDKNGNSRAFYGRFHIVLRKENGTWKILVDTDSSEGGTIGEKEFAAAKPMEG